jgi:hypothetical protein
MTVCPSRVTVFFRCDRVIQGFESRSQNFPSAPIVDVVFGRELPEQPL